MTDDEFDKDEEQEAQIDPETGLPIADDEGLDEDLPVVDPALIDEDEV